jgi:hypothetical protein
MGADEQCGVLTESLINERLRVQARQGAAIN